MLVFVTPSGKGFQKPNILVGFAGKFAVKIWLTVPLPTVQGKLILISFIFDGSKFDTKKLISSVKLRVL